MACGKRISYAAQVRQQLRIIMEACSVVVSWAHSQIANGPRNDPRGVRFAGESPHGDALGATCRRRSDFKLLSSWATVRSIVRVRRNCTTTVRGQKEYRLRHRATDAVIAFQLKSKRFAVTVHSLSIPTSP